MTVPQKIVVYSLGGTIAMVPHDQGIEVGLTGPDMIEDLQWALPGVLTECVGFRNVPSGDLTFEDIADLARQISVKLRQGSDGAVIIQGTDTMEEVAFMLDLLLNEQKPVVVVGALRHHQQAGADGPANLLDALRAASSPSMRELGVLVVMNEQIHAARFVRKSHTHNVAGFVSPIVGPLGWIIEGCPQLLVRPTRTSPILEWRGNHPRVTQVNVGFDFDAEVLEMLLERGADGIVLAGLGGGHIPAKAVDTVTRLARKIPVVLTSRTGSGAIMTQTYGYPGGEIDLLKRGLIYGSFLDSAKARILLTLLLGEGADRERIAATFCRYAF